MNQATKLISSALGSSKKPQPEVKKVLQMAAVAAKKVSEPCLKVKTIDSPEQLSATGRS